MGGVVQKVSETIFGRPEQPEIPEAKVPAAPAPSRRQDTGADIVIGTDASKNARVSGKGSGKSGTTGGDVLGNLGRGGLSI